MSAILPFGRRAECFLTVGIEFDQNVSAGKPMAASVKIF
jgi:hypothetical protein